MKKIDRALNAYKQNVSGDRTEGFIKTSEKSGTVMPEKSGSSKPPQKPNSKKAPPSSGADAGYAKAAKFLLLVGPQQAAEVLKHFSAEDVEKIVREITAVRKISKSESAEVLKDFGHLDRKAAASAKKDFNTEYSESGPDKALRMLTAAFGDEKGRQIFDKVLPFGGRRPFDFLDELEPEQILMVIKNEPPYVLSVVLSFLEPQLSSAIISKLPETSRKEIIIRIARQGEIAPGVVSKMEAIFQERIRAQGRVVTEEIDGKSILAGILKHMPLSFEDEILDDLSDHNRELADEIKERIYTFELVEHIDDRDMQYLLRDFENSELAVIIKGKNSEKRARILDNLSERRKEMILEESVYLGEMRRADVDKSTREFVDYIIDLEQKGEITIMRGDDEFI